MEDFWAMAGFTIKPSKEGEMLYLGIVDKENKTTMHIAVPQAPSYHTLYNALLYYTAALCEGFDNAGKKNRGFLA